MDKYEYKIRSEEIKELIAQKEYVEAAEIADTIDWRRVKSVMMLCTISDLYKINRRYEDSRNLLLLAYDRHPGGRSIVYSLCELSIKMGDFVMAVEYYKEFVQIAPKDSGRYILQYKLYEAQDVSLEERIAVLEELKARDYTEKWAYELAYLYHRVGLGTKCVEECDDLVLWFGEGKYVVKAMELKMLHDPLTQDQQIKYEYLRNLARVEAEEVAEEIQPEVQQVTADTKVISSNAPTQELPSKEVEIQVKPMGVGQYDTINIQKELAENMRELWIGTEAGPSEDVMDAETKVIAETMLDQTDNIAVSQEELEAQENTQAEPTMQEVFFGETGELDVTADQVLEVMRSEARGEVVPEPILYQQGMFSDEMKEVQFTSNDTQEMVTAVPLEKTGYDRILGMEYDGQISLVLPEAEQIEKQITGQIRLEDILLEWERMKKDNEEKHKEAIRQRVKEQTGAMFTEFEAAVRDGLLEQLESGKLSAEDLEQATHAEMPSEDVPEIYYQEDTDEVDEVEELEEIIEVADLEDVEVLEEPEAVEEVKAAPELEALEETETVESEADAEEEDQGASEEVLEVEFEEETEEVPEEESGEETFEEYQEHPAEEYVEEYTEEYTEEVYEEGVEEYSEEAYSEEYAEETYEEGAEEYTEDAYEGYGEEYPEDYVEETYEEDTEAFAEETTNEVEAYEEVDAAETKEDAEVETSEESETEEAEDSEEIEEATEAEPSEEGKEATEEGEEPSEEEKEATEEDAEPSEEEKEATEEGAEPSEEEKEATEEGEEPSEEAEETAKDEDADKEPVEAKSKVRQFSPEEAELFGSFAHNEIMRERIVAAIDNISMASYTGNVIITGDEGMDTLALAKSLIKEIQNTDSNFSGKTAKISGGSLNKKDMQETLDKLSGGALIVQSACAMSSVTVEKMHRVLEQEERGIIVILIDAKKTMNRFLKNNPILKETFTVRVDIAAMDNDALVKHGVEYAKEQEYSIDDMGILALHTRIAEMQTSDHAVNINEVKEIIDEAIKHANRKTIGHFFDIIVAKRYDDEDMIILREKDFI
ncbi:MAG: hypothetical protein IJW63_10940 [Lachnospiraceae bacterium]|nr:hypothetical protein [Lachnospiraceae bacterium]